MGFIGSKGPLIIKKPHGDLLSALKKEWLLARAGRITRQ